MGICDAALAMYAILCGVCVFSARICVFVHMYVCVRAFKCARVSVRARASAIACACKCVRVSVCVCVSALLIIFFVGVGSFLSH